jgi:hypothetical protein
MLNNFWIQVAVSLLGPGPRGGFRSDPEALKIAAGTTGVVIEICIKYPRG